MKTTSGELALELKEEMTSAIGFESGHEEEETSDRIFRVGLVVDTISKSSSREVFEVHFDNLRFFR